MINTEQEPSRRAANTKASIETRSNHWTLSTVHMTPRSWATSVSNPRMASPTIRRLGLSPRPVTEANLQGVTLGRRQLPEIADQRSTQLLNAGVGQPSLGFRGYESDHLQVH